MTGRDESGSESSKIDDEETVMKGLLDAFASSFTLDEIASAYCKAGKDADFTAELLVEMQRSGSASMVDNASKQSCEGNEKPRLTNSRNHPASVGSVSSIIGKSYIRATPLKNGSTEAWKPMKLDPKILPESAIWGEEAKSSCVKNDPRRRDMEEFLYSMLEDGFKLERDVIRQVLDASGYDMPKSMEKLIGLSAESLDQKTKLVCDSGSKFPELGSKAEILTRQGQSKNRFVGNRGSASNMKEEVSSEESHTVDLQREVLTALFSGTERNSEVFLPRKRLTTVKRSGMFGKAVSEPLYDLIAVCETNAVSSQEDDDYAKEQDERYQSVRKAVKEYRVMMKEYYQSAIEAFAKGDSDRAHKLFAEGYFFHKKACEKDEESSEMILETRNEDTHDAMVLDLHDHGAKEAIRLLKCHLSSFSGLSFKHLRVIIEKNEEDSSKGSRRRLVLKLLERESINWEEEENGRTILINLDRINRKNLSFAKK